MIDFLDQFFHAAEGSAADGLLGDAIKPKLDLVQPGGRSGSKVYVKSRPGGDPAFDADACA